MRAADGGTLMLDDGRTLRLERLGAETDRYGRLAAFAALPDAGPSLQHALLEQGLARVSARIAS